VGSSSPRKASGLAAGGRISKLRKPKKLPVWRQAPVPVAPLEEYIPASKPQAADPASILSERQNRVISRIKGRADEVLKRERRQGNSVPAGF
jgi:hypothetical protein